MADGHFHKRGNTVRLDQAMGDIEHLRAYKKYVNVKRVDETISIKNNFKNSQNNASVTVTNSDIVPALVKLYDICSTKTTNPPDFSKYNHLSEDQWLAMIIGFIDGDGYIQLTNSGKNKNHKRIKINIEIHSTWKYNLTYMKSVVYNRFGKGHRMKEPKINSDGLVSTQIASSRVIDGLYQFIKDNNLYVLDRKWTKCNDVVYFNRHII